MNNKFSIIPSLMILTGAAVGALSGLFIKILPYSTAPMLGFRLGVPFLIMLPYVFKKRNILGKPKDRILLWSGGLLNLLRMFFYIIAFKLTAMGNAVVLLYLWPVFALFVTAFMKSKVPDIKNILIVAAAFSGVVIMNIHREFSLSSTDLIGSVSMILSAFIFSIAVFVYKKALSGYSEGEVIYFQNSIGALVFLPFLMLEIGKYPFSDIIIGTAYGLFVGVLTFLLFFFALKRVSVFQYSILTYSEIIFAVIFGMVCFNETLVLNQAAGMLIVIASSFYAQRIRDDNS